LTVEQTWLESLGIPQNNGRRVELTAIRPYENGRATGLIIFVQTDGVNATA
jgi:hypothetical protein